MRRILIIAPQILKQCGGISAVANNIIKGFTNINNNLAKNEIELTFLSLNERGKVKITDNIKVIGCERYPTMALTGELQALIKNKNSIKNYNIVHAHGRPFELFPYIFSVPTVLTLHGVWWKLFKYGSIYTNLWPALMTTRLRFFYYSKVTRITVVSEYIINELKAEGYNVDKVSVIENPVSDDFFAVRKREEPIIFYPASISPRKNQYGFLKAVLLIKKELSDFRIIFTRPNPKFRKYMVKIKKFVRENNLKNIEITGFLPYTKILELYSRASIVALMSFQEGLPMSVIEAMATGTPVLGSSIPVFKYAIKHGKTGLLADPTNPKDIAEKLLLLINDVNLRKRLGRNAKNEANERWRAEKIAKKYFELYLSLLSS